MRPKKIPSRTVAPRFDGTWANLLEGNSRASSLSTTEAEAVALARAALLRDGGGLLFIKGAGGKLVSTETILAHWMPR